MCRRRKTTYPLLVSEWPINPNHLCLPQTSSYYRPHLRRMTLLHTILLRHQTISTDFNFHHRRQSCQVSSTHTRAHRRLRLWVVFTVRATVLCLRARVFQLEENPRWNPLVFSLSLSQTQTRRRASRRFRRRTRARTAAIRLLTCKEKVGSDFSFCWRS